jgi:hypothetical protein
MVDDVLLNKAASIERAVARVREEHDGDDANLVANQTRQDAIILNLQRACESSIDAAMHMLPAVYARGADVVTLFPPRSRSTARPALVAGTSVAPPSAPPASRTPPVAIGRRRPHCAPPASASDEAPAA